MEVIDMSHLDTDSDESGGKGERNAVPPAAKKPKTSKVPKEPHFFADEASWDGEIVKLRVLGKPLPWARTKRGWNGNVYNPRAKSQIEFSHAVSGICMREFGEVPCFEAYAAVKAKIWFFLPCKDKQPKGKPRVPDLDNLVKFVLDSLNGVVYMDDKQVVHVTACKHWSSMHEKGCTLMSFQEADNVEYEETIF